MAAYLRLQRELCPRCGTAEADWVDREGRFRDDPPYEATAFRCHGCAEVERVSAEIPQKERGVRVVMIPAQEDDDRG